MTQKEIIKNLLQIKELADADCPKMASERIGWLINDMTEEDYKYRQGKRKDQMEASYIGAAVSFGLLALTLLYLVLTS